MMPSDSVNKKLWRGAFSRLLAELPPRFIALVVFAGGVELLISGSTPAGEGRLKFVREFVPLPVAELSHFAASLAGAVLLILAWGLGRRLNAAYWLTVSFLILSVVFSILKGFDLGEILALTSILCLLTPFRRFYYRPSSLLAERLSRPWLALILLALLSTVAIGVVSHRSVHYSDELWWQFALDSDASRFLRATLGVSVLILIFVLARLLRPAAPPFIAPTRQTIERIQRILANSDRAAANLAFLGDKSFLFHPDRESFLMYRVEGRSWIALGDPIGDKEASKDLVREFRRLVDRFGGWLVFYEIGLGELPMYLDLGLTLVKMGEEGQVPMDRWTPQDSVYHELERVQKKAVSHGATLEWLAPGEARPVEAELRAVSDAWLTKKRTREKSFSLGCFDMHYLNHFTIGVIRCGGKIVAFANILPGKSGGEFSGDLMRYLPAEAPKGVMDYLFFEMLCWGKKHGYSRFNLGMAPLSGLDGWAMAPLWHRFGSFVYRFGGDFYNFQGLRLFKEKFNPAWEPRYLATPGGVLLPLILRDIANLISGGLRGIFIK